LLAVGLHTCTAVARSLCVSWAFLSLLLTFFKRLQWLKCVCSCSCEPVSELRSIKCHMRSHSVTCHPTQANTFLSPLTIIDNILSGFLIIITFYVAFLLHCTVLYGVYMYRIVAIQPFGCNIIIKFIHLNPSQGSHFSLYLPQREGQAELIWVKVKVRILLFMDWKPITELWSVRHLPYVITQCYLPPDTGERGPP